MKKRKKNNFIKRYIIYTNTVEYIYIYVLLIVQANEND